MARARETVRTWSTFTCVVEKLACEAWTSERRHGALLVATLSGEFAAKQRRWSRGSFRATAKVTGRSVYHVTALSTSVLDRVAAPGELAGSQPAGQLRAHAPRRAKNHNGHSPCHHAVFPHHSRATRAGRTVLIRVNDADKCSRGVARSMPVRNALLPCSQRVSFPSHSDAQQSRQRRGSRVCATRFSCVSGRRGRISPSMT